MSFTCALRSWWFPCILWEKISQTYSAHVATWTVTHPNDILRITCIATWYIYFSFATVRVTVCYSNLLQQLDTATCYSNLLQQLVTVTCYSNLLQQLVTATCYNNLLQQLVTATCYSRLAPLHTRSYEYVIYCTVDLLWLFIFFIRIYIYYVKIYLPYQCTVDDIVILLL